MKTQGFTTVSKQGDSTYVHVLFGQARGQAPQPGGEGLGKGGHKVHLSHIPYLASPVPGTATTV